MRADFFLFDAAGREAMRGATIDAGSSVTGVTAEVAEGRGEQPHRSPSVALAVLRALRVLRGKSVVVIDARPTRIRRRHTKASRAIKKEDLSLQQPVRVKDGCIMVARA
jgi:hypothetical protein